MRKKTLLLLVVSCITFFCTLENVWARQVKISGSRGNWHLFVEGKPFYIKGAGFGKTVHAGNIDYYFSEMKKIGLNSFRTWGIGHDTPLMLEKAEKYGLMVDVGIWLLQNKKGEKKSVDYINGEKYKTETLKEIGEHVKKFKDYPAVLMWNVGNEVVLDLETEEEKIAFAKYVEEICKLIHKIDPNHPVTSSSAWSLAWPYFKKYTPSLDIYGVNVYGGLVVIKEEWEKIGVDKPYLITEYGPHGEWEVSVDGNEQAIIPSEEVKANAYFNGWKNYIEKNKGLNIGGYAFIFEGNEDFGGAWFNIFMLGRKRAAYWKIYEMFTGKQVKNSSPRISQFKLSKITGIYPEEKISVSVEAKDLDKDRLNYVFKICGRKVWDEGIYPVRFEKKKKKEFVITAPCTPGVYFLYVYVSDGQGNIAVEGKSIKVIEKKAIEKKVIEKKEKGK